MISIKYNIVVWMFLLWQSLLQGTVIMVPNYSSIGLAQKATV